MEMLVIANEYALKPMTKRRSLAPAGPRLLNLRRFSLPSITQEDITEELPIAISQPA